MLSPHSRIMNFLSISFGPYLRPSFPHFVWLVALMVLVSLAMDPTDLQWAIFSLVFQIISFAFSCVFYF